jgi:hypothetical protein
MYNDLSKSGGRMTYRGQVRNGMVFFDNGAPPDGTFVNVEALDTQACETDSGNAPSDWSELLALKGSASDLPADLAAEHDHYLYGTPKRGNLR